MNRPPVSTVTKARSRMPARTREGSESESVSIRLTLGYAPQIHNPWRRHEPWMLHPLIDKTQLIAACPDGEATGLRRTSTNARWRLAPDGRQTGHRTTDRAVGSLAGWAPRQIGSRANRDPRGPTPSPVPGVADPSQAWVTVSGRPAALRARRTSRQRG